MGNGCFRRYFPAITHDSCDENVTFCEPYRPVAASSVGGSGPHEGCRQIAREGTAWAVDSAAGDELVARATSQVRCPRSVDDLASQLEKLRGAAAERLLPGNRC